MDRRERRPGRSRPGHLLGIRAGRPLNRVHVTTVADSHRSLRVLIADEHRSVLEQTARQLETLGHDVVAEHLAPHDAKDAVRHQDPDVAIVRVAEDDEHALQLVGELVDAVNCPVVALLDSENADFVRRAAEIGLMAFAAPGAPAALQSALDLALRRFDDLQQLTTETDELRGALERRTTVERAKGVLMERHRLTEDGAYQLLRAYSRDHRQSLLSTARQVLEAHQLLSVRPDRTP